MIGYIVLGTNDLPRARSFYDTLLIEMGVTRLMEFGDRGSGWAASMDKPMLCIMKPYNGKPASVGNGAMAGIAVAHMAVASRLLIPRSTPLGTASCGPDNPPSSPPGGAICLPRRLFWEPPRLSRIRASSRRQLRATCLFIEGKRCAQCEWRRDAGVP